MKDFHITFNFIGGSLRTLIIIGYIIMQMHDYLFWFLIKSHYIYSYVYIIYLIIKQWKPFGISNEMGDMHAWLVFMWVSSNQLQTKKT